MTTLDPLTALEREQLRYIVERVPEWPSDAEWLWVGMRGFIYGTDAFDPHAHGSERGKIFDDISPSFTRAQYDAMKAELSAPAIDYRAHCEALAGALENLVNNAWASCEDEDGQLVGRATQEEWDAHCEATDAACAVLTRWKEDSK